MRLLSMLWCFFITIHCMSQNNVATENLDQLQFELINEVDGLSNRNIGEIVQDKDGFIWIATADGLNRYDGYSIKVYRHDDKAPDSPLNNWISNLAVDNSGDLVIGYRNGGISILNPHTEHFVHYPAGKNGIPANELVSLYIDKQNNIWVGHLRSGLSQFFPGTKRLNSATILPSNESFNKSTVSQILQDKKDQSLWLATTTGLYNYQPYTKKLSQHKRKSEADYQKEGEHYFRLVNISGDRLLLSSWGEGLSVYNPSIGTWKNYLHEGKHEATGTYNIIYSLTFRNEHSVWVSASGKGFGYFDFFSGEYQFLNEKTRLRNKLPDGNMTKSFRDKDGNIWISHYLGISLLKNQHNNFKFFPFPVSKSDNGNYYYVTGVIKDSLHHTTIVSTSFAEGIYLIDEFTGKRKILSVGFQKGEAPTLLVSDMKSDDKGRIWISTRDYIYKYDAENKKLITIPQPPVDKDLKNSPFFNEMYYSGGDSLWIASLRQGLYCFHLSSMTYTRYVHQSGSPKSLSSNRITGIVIDDKKRIWLTGTNSEINIIDPNANKVFTIPNVQKSNDNTSTSIIYAITKDQQGTIWMATGKGLFSTANNKSEIPEFIHHGLKEGLPSEIITSLHFDKSNTLWFASAVALCSMNTHTGEIKTYNSADGLNDDYLTYDFDNGPGNLQYIYYYGGYYEFTPVKNKLQTTPEPILTGVKLFNQDIDYNSNLTREGILQLKPNENFISFDFTTINFNYPSKTAFSYKLEGISDTWSEASNRRYASYAHLPGGTYLFKVKVSDGEGNRGPEKVLLRFTIQTPFWKTTPFILTLCLFLAIIIYFIYVYRIRAIKKTEELKTAFNTRIAEAEMRALRAQMNPHFIFNCLNSINRYIVKSDQAKASHYLTRFSKLIRLILENSNNKTVSLEQDLEALKIYVEMESLRFENKFEFKIETAENVNVFSTAVPPMILQPFIENAIWHGLLHKDSKGTLHIRIEKTFHSLQCIIEDNGIGRKRAAELKSKTATTRKSMGMQLTEDRIQLLKSQYGGEASIMIEDLKDNNGSPCGTRVTLLIPLEN